MNDPVLPVLYVGIPNNEVHNRIKNWAPVLFLGNIHGGRRWIKPELELQSLQTKD